MTPTARTYATAYGRPGHYPRFCHVISAPLGHLPDGWKAVCNRVIRGTESSTPPHPLCPRCARTVGGTP